MEYSLMGQLQLNSDMRVAIQDGGTVDHLDIWLLRKGLIGKEVKITVEEIEDKAVSQ